MFSHFQEVDCFNRKSIPTKQDTILTDFDINPDIILEMEVYFRTPEDCTFNRGNWIVDLIFLNKVICIKLPKEMTEEQVLDFIKPLTDILDKKNNAKTN